MPIPGRVTTTDTGRHATCTPLSGVPDEPLIDPRQLAAWLSVSVHTVRQWISRGPEAGLLPRMLRINGQVRFRPTDVRAWLEEREM